MLVDKHGLTAGLRAPTHTAYVTAKPTGKEFRETIEEFWWAPTYVAKYLWRDEVFGARATLDAEIRLYLLSPMLAWARAQVEAEAVRLAELLGCRLDSTSTPL